MAEFWKKKKIIEVDIQGEPTRFKGVPIGTLFKIKNLAEGNKALAKLLSYFFVDKSRDTEVITTAEGVTNIKPISPSIATMRQQTLEQGILGIQALLTSEESQELLAEILYYSAIDLSRDKTVQAFAKEVADQCPEVILELLIGVVKANKGIISTLGKLLPQMPKSVADHMEGVKKVLAED